MIRRKRLHVHIELEVDRDSFTGLQYVVEGIARMLSSWSTIVSAKVSCGVEEARAPWLVGSRWFYDREEAEGYRKMRG